MRLAPDVRHEVAKERAPLVLLVVANLRQGIQQTLGRRQRLRHAAAVTDPRDGIGEGAVAIRLQRSRLTMQTPAVHLARRRHSGARDNRGGNCAGRSRELQKGSEAEIGLILPPLQGL